jgi:hypothetical protein
MWNVWQWAVASNERAVANARAAAVDCSRRRLERAEVQDYLLSRGIPAAGLAERERPLRLHHV